MKISVKGTIELDKRLSKIPEKYPKVITALSSFMQNETKKNLRQQVYSRSVWWKRTGKLQQSVQIERKSELTHRVFIGVEYGKYIEGGTKAHTIRPKRAKLLAFHSKSGKTIFARSVRHPGTKARPFFTPAVKATQTKANTLAQQILKDI